MADKNFVVKNGLIVGDTATINGVIINPSGATSGQVLKFNGDEFVPESSVDLAGTVYLQTIGALSPRMSRSTSPSASPV